MTPPLTRVYERVGRGLAMRADVPRLPNGQIAHPHVDAIQPDEVIRSIEDAGLQPAAMDVDAFTVTLQLMQLTIPLRQGVVASASAGIERSVDRLISTLDAMVAEADAEAPRIAAAPLLPLQRLDAEAIHKSALGEAIRFRQAARRFRSRFEAPRSLKEEPWHDDALYLALALDRAFGGSCSKISWKSRDSAGVRLVERFLDRTGVRRGNDAQRISAAAIKQMLPNHPWAAEVGLTGFHPSTDVKKEGLADGDPSSGKIH